MNKTKQTTNWFLKFALSFLAIVGVINTLLFVIAPLLPTKLAQFILPGGFFLLALAVIFTFCFAFYWNNKEKKELVNSEKITSWFITLVRYWIAFLLFDFGFQKLFETNFAYSYHINDSLVKTLSGTELTWNYFAYSYGLSVILALFQIVGSILLLFRRTTLLGVTLLLPVVLNIVLINVFYQIGPITLFTSILITLGLLYLVYQQNVDIIGFFNQYKNTLPSIGNAISRTAARLLCVLIPCLFVLYYNYDVYRSKKYFGKWKVESLSRNGNLISDQAWEKDTLAWKVIYFEQRGKLLYCPNPNLYIDSVSIFMKYEYDENIDALKVISFENNPKSPDTIPVQINKFNGTSMEWNMIFNKDTLQMKLKKETK
ncbi:hypothetical protein [Flavobacterium sp.]